MEQFRKSQNTYNNTKNDPVNHPKHYTGKYECIEVMEEAMGTQAVVDFCKCNAFKYLYRHMKKNGIEDLKKAQWYLNKLIEITDQKLIDQNDIRNSKPDIHPNNIGDAVNRQ